MLFGGESKYSAGVTGIRGCFFSFVNQNQCLFRHRF